MKKNNKKSRLSYEPEADVLTWEISKDPIDYATEFGDMIIHFNHKNIPVLVEVLGAKNFMKRAEKVIGFKQPQPRLATV